MNQCFSATAKSVRAAIIVFTFSSVLVGRANAQSTLAYWNFNGLTNTTPALPGASGNPTSFSADLGSGTLWLTSDGSGHGGTVIGNIRGDTGTQANTFNLNENGLNSLELQSGVTGTPLAGNGEYIEAQFTMSGQSNIGLSYMTYASAATGFNSGQWSYSKDGTTYTPFGSAVTQSNPVGSNHINVGSFDRVGPLIAPADLNNFNGTVYMRYTLTGASGTSATNYNRIDNLLIQSGATAPAAQNAATLPQPGDIVMGLNNTDANNSFEIVRGATAPNAGVRYPAAVWQFNNTSLPTPAVQNVAFIEYNQFDNLSGVSHNAYGNLIGMDFGTTTAGTGGGKIYSLATQGPNPTGAGIANAQIIGNTNTTSASINALGQSGAGDTACGTGACLTGVGQTRLSGLSVSPDNTKIAVVGTNSKRVLVYDYTAGNTAGGGASLANGRESASTFMSGNSDGTAWKDNNTVLAFSSTPNGTSNQHLYEVNATTMAQTVVGPSFATGPTGSNVTALYYNPAKSKYLYGLWSGFSAAGSPPSLTKLLVFDPTNNYNLLTPQTDTNGYSGIDLSGLSINAPNAGIGQSSMSGRNLALDASGNLLIGGFDTTITYLPAANFASDAAVSAIANNSTTFYYGSTYNATAFPNIDVGFGLRGDYNSNGATNLGDYVRWRKLGGAQDGYVAWREGFGTTSPGSDSDLAGSAVPEPSSVALFLLGLVGMGLRRRSA
jgi:hypothetical protein